MIQCKECQSSFEITDRHRDFYARVQVPEPTFCPECRLQRRFAFRNERKMYRRKCDLTGKNIISFHHPDKPYKVYDQAEWWSDKWNPMSYGREFDFSRPFFEQFRELQLAVPRISMTVSHCENCEYAPYSVDSKNCYMCISCLGSEDLYYSYQTNSSRDCVDCSLCTRCELCYECLYCVQLFQSGFCQNCENGENLWFCQDSKNCKNCIGCKNLLNKEYHVFNQPVTKTEFEALKTSLLNHQILRQVEAKAKAFFLTQIQRANYLVNCENCTGDHLANSKNTFVSFDNREIEDGYYLYVGPRNVRDCQDMHYSPNTELVYEAMSAVNNFNTKFVLHSWDNKNSAYIDECFYSQDLFGCIGVRHQQYCILNKQYSKEEYGRLLPRILEHMTKTGEWGEFFPMNLSTFAYNETLAQDYFPLSEAETVARGLEWRDFHDEPLKVEKEIPANRLPDATPQVPEDILNWAIVCEATNRPFKLQKQELQFYRKLGLPVPHLHPDERYNRRMALRNPLRLYDRTCAKTGQPLKTTFAPERPELVVSEEYYLKTVY